MCLFLLSCMLFGVGTVALACYLTLYQGVDAGKAEPACQDAHLVFEVQPNRCYSIELITPSKICRMAVGETRAGRSLADSTILSWMFSKTFVLKADDLSNPVSANFRKCIETIYRNKARITLGVIAGNYSPRWRHRVIRFLIRVKSLLHTRLTWSIGANFRRFAWRERYLRCLNPYNYEFYCHGWDHYSDLERNIFEFQGSGYEYQKEHLKLAKSAMNRIGLPTTVFGPPFLRTDDDTFRALADEGFKIAFNRSMTSEKNISVVELPIQLWLEDWQSREPRERGKPRLIGDILEEYAKHDDVECLVAHMHPNNWTGQWDTFELFLAHVSKKRQFTNPEAYFHFLADIPEFKLIKTSHTNYILDLTSCRYSHFLTIEKPDTGNIKVKERPDWIC